MSETPFEPFSTIEKAVAKEPESTGAVLRH